MIDFRITLSREKRLRAGDWWRYSADGVVILDWTTPSAPSMVATRHSLMRATPPIPGGDYL
jgi:hypothetical protein